MAVDKEILNLVKEYKDNGYTALLGNRIIDSLVEYGDFWNEMVRAIAVPSPDNEIKGYDFNTDGSIFDNTIIPEERWKNKFQELESTHALLRHTGHPLYRAYPAPLHPGAIRPVRQRWYPHNETPFLRFPRGRKKLGSRESVHVRRRLPIGAGR